jgi:hypothetical protein
VRVVDHPELGRLTRRKGKWRGQYGLVLDGGRRGPDEKALVAALAFSVEAVQPQVEGPLREHRSNGTDVPPETEVWGDVRMAYVWAKADGTVEWGLRVTWDDEHTLGARFDGQRLIELNGSVLAP